jgi:hypothetical protein
VQGCSVAVLAVVVAVVPANRYNLFYFFFFPTPRVFL